ncbi:hypothetical protein M8C21_000902 [Ambrosia artemisiifolia]|uniref:Large ribosomal subunit protein mL53 n=1 Tax=Ambrosia artemisiifolia TaxID=4212 RepID=A0AAD5BLK2_AMBAR|nr:hypothetical protein M8C21_000902 [Ambrosia artemisiifolia]
MPLSIESNPKHVEIEFNALDPRTAACMEFLAQCNARTAKESNPSCQLLVKRSTNSFPPQISVSFVNGVEEVFDATSTPAQTIRKMILEKGQQLETEQMFREAGEKWPVIIPAEELYLSFPGTKCFLDDYSIQLSIVLSLAKVYRILDVGGYEVTMMSNLTRFPESIPFLGFLANGSTALSQDLWLSIFVILLD